MKKRNNENIPRKHTKQKVLFFERTSRITFDYLPKSALNQNHKFLQSKQYLLNFHPVLISI